MSTKIGVIVPVLMIIAAIFTIVDTPIVWWERFISPNDTGGSAPTVQLASTPLSVTPRLTPTIAPSFTPTAALSLDQMLEAAKSARTYDGRDRALRKVAEIAVSRGEYSVAIEAASASASYDAESETLTFVARCAVEEGLFDYALQAADEIPTYSDNDRMKVEVLNAVKVAESEPFFSIGDPPSTSCR